MIKRPDIQAEFDSLWAEIDTHAALGEPLSRDQQLAAGKSLGRALVWRSFLWGLTHPFGGRR